MTRTQRLARWCSKNAAYILLAAAFALGALVGTAISCTVSTNASAADRAGVTKQARTSEDDRPKRLTEDAALIEMSQPAAEQQFAPDQADVEMLATLIWGEARGIESDTEKAAVVWCVLNRVDSPNYPDTIAEVVTQRHQFSGYSASYPAPDKFKALAEDVLTRWNAEKSGCTDVGRVLPREYVFFTGDGARNNFTVEWLSADTWDWSLPSPYES